MTHKLVLPLLVAVALLSLGACSSVTPEPQPDPLMQASAVSVTLPGFVITPETTLRWRSELRWLDDPEGQHKRRAQVLQQALQREFERKGYPFLQGGKEATFDIVALALMDGLRDQEKLERVFRLYPSLAAPAKGYGRGTVLVAIAPAGSRDIVWRGALEVFTDPGQLTESQRDQRLEWAAGRLLNSIPYRP